MASTVQHRLQRRLDALRLRLQAMEAHPSKVKHVRIIQDCLKRRIAHTEQQLREAV